MRLARGNRDRPAVVAAATVAAAVDTAVVAKVVVASEEATRNSLFPVAFLTTAKFARRGSAAVRTRDCAQTPRRIEAGTTQHFDENLGRAGFEPAKA
jgi:hypothetical protein